MQGDSVKLSAYDIQGEKEATGFLRTQEINGKLYVYTQSINGASKRYLANDVIKHLVIASAKVSKPVQIFKISA